LVADNDVEEEGSPRYHRPHLGELDPEAPEAELESQLGSSDYDILGDEPRKNEKKSRLHKRRADAEELEQELEGLNEEPVSERPPREERKREQRPERRLFDKEEEEEDMGEFIEEPQLDREVTKHRKRHPTRSMAHAIFELDKEEKEEAEQREEPEGMKLKEIYAEQELEEEYMTEYDRKIKVTDIPERIQRQFTEEQLYRLVGEIDLEAEWIMERMKTSSANMENVNAIKKKIIMALDYYKKDNLEAPYIVYYRSMNLEPELNVAEIWKIFELDKEWNKLSDYKENIRKQFAQVRNSLEENKAEVFESRYIDHAKTIRELNDVEAHIHYLKEFYQEEMQDDESNKKEKKNIRPIKRSFLQEIKANRIHDFARKFSLTASELATNIDLIQSGDPNARTKLYVPNDPNIEPYHLASKYVTTVYEKEEDVLKTVCKYLAYEMFSHPYLRAFARAYFRNTCVLTTEPTEEGRKEIDVFHPSYRVKRINKKPVETFKNDLYMDILQNENKGLVRVSIESMEDLKGFSERICQAYNVEYKSQSTVPEEILNKWKVMREECVRVLVVDYLFPEFIKDIRNELFEKAENFIFQESTRAFNELLSLGPYKKEKQAWDDDLFTRDDVPKVMSFIYDSAKNEAYCVNLDQFGEILDYQIFDYAIGARQSKMAKNDENDAFKKKCKELMEKYQPDLIVVGANDLKCKILKEQIVSADAEINRGGEGSTWITYGDLTIPRICATSPVMEKSLPNYNMFLRCAISLGRFKQSPISEILQLWQEDYNRNFCLSIPLHPLQKLVNQQKLAEYLEMQAISVTNWIGVEINRIYPHNHLRSPLQFVSGLGPRKAAYLFDTVKNLEGIFMRVQLLGTEKNKKIIDRRIFMNCAGFLKIKTDPNEFQVGKRYDLLDLTRIHPEYYPLARRLAKSAAEDDVEIPHSKKEKEKVDDSEYVEIVLKDPKKLTVLDLYSFTRKSEEKHNFNMKSIITFIMGEFNNPYSDPRKPHIDIDPKKLFYLMIGDENFREGHMVLAKVIKVDNQHVKCRLLNDLEATVWIKDIYDEDQYTSNTYVDEFKVKEMKEKYREGMLFEARIKSINENSLKIDLTVRPSLLESHKNFIKVLDLDSFFVISDEDIINKNYHQEAKHDNKKYIPRNIKHNNFKNVTFTMAFEQLRNKEIGEFIFRPSSKGLNNLTLSWKFYKHVIAHVDIIEEEKIPGANIGSKLRISNEVYSSLNEIVERYIKPCERLVRSAISSRKFCQFENSEELEKRLRDDKGRDNSIIPYLFTILPEAPGYIIMGYAPSPNQAKKEYIRVKPAGLFFHDEYFSNLEDLSFFFKKNYGTDSYRDYVKKTRPPVLEVRKDFNESNFSVSGQDVGSQSSRSERGQNSSYSNQGPSNQYKANKACRNCNELGHFAHECPSKKKSSRDSYIGKRERSPEEDRDRSRDYHSRSRVSNFRSPRRNEESGWGTIPEEDSKNFYFTKFL
jgi:transcription elongation factor SPT6